MKRLTELFLTALLAVCCSGQGFDPALDDKVPDESFGHDMIVLGRQLDDPYSVENMTKALSSVYPTKADRVALPPTHHYVRFLPADEDQYARLERQGLDLLDHPMDYEILREGDWYHDPQIPEGQITWQYTVVPVGFVFPPDIPYEILDRCYIPDEQMLTKGAGGIDWASVEQEAYRLTGNAGRLTESLTKGERSSARPAGRITIVDASLGGTPEGVRGVRVTCNSFVKTARAYTDEEGNYQMDKSFSSKPRYRLTFKNSSGFSIGFNLVLVPASSSTFGTGEPTGLDAQITQESDRRLFMRSVVNNAGYDYYQRCAAKRPAIKTPPGNLRIWLFQGLDSSCAVMMQQGVLVDGSKLASLLGDFSFLLKIFLPDILLGLKNHDTYASIYADAVHEFAHASHYMAAGKDYWNDYVRFIITSFVSSGFVTYGVGTEENFGHCEVGEMWAYFLQTVLYRERYGDTNVPAFGLHYWFHPQILLQLEDRGLSSNRIFQVLGPAVTDRETLRKKLVSYYPEFKSAINQAFIRYD
ncbi:MAG: hypothetical protein K6E35_04975 [Bacteroidales bacterium]|nr:hypothetical protein [Bacteroidales bacterium]